MNATDPAERDWDLGPLAEQVVKPDARVALERLRAQVMTLVPNHGDTIGQTFSLGLARGHRQACNQVFDLISKTLGDYVPEKVQQ